MFSKVPNSVADIAKQMAAEKPEIETSGLFSSTPEEVAEEIKNNQPEPETTAPGTPAAPITNPEEENEPFDAETWASTAVDALEGFNEKILVRVYESQQLKSVNPETLEAVLHKLTLAQYNQPVTFLPEENKVVKTIGRVNEYKKKTTFKPEKRAKLEKAVARYLRSLNIQNDLPPGKALLLAVAIAEAPLVLPLVEHYADEYLNKKKPSAKTETAPVMKSHVTETPPPAPAETEKTKNSRLRNSTKSKNEPKP